MAATRELPTVEEIKEMTIAQLREFHNELNPEEQVKSFRNKAAAVKRVMELVKQARPGEEKEEKQVIRTRATEFVGRGEVKPPRPTSKRARMLRELREDGLTAEEIAEKFDWKPRDVMDALRLLAKANGYNVYLGEDGKWRAAEPK